MGNFLDDPKTDVHRRLESYQFGGSIGSPPPSTKQSQEHITALPYNACKKYNRILIDPSDNRGHHLYRKISGALYCWLSWLSPTYYT